jgi:hypothetical protein
MPAISPRAALIIALAPSHDAFVAPVTSRVKNVMPRVAALLDVMRVLVANEIPCYCLKNHCYLKCFPC